MSFTLPKLPYAQNALEPFISKETLKYHYGKHHQAYVNKLNKLIAGSSLEKQSLETIIRKAQGSIFNNAAQVWNHTFYWHCLSPKPIKEPSKNLLDSIQKYFGSLSAFKTTFIQIASAHFGSGWVWLVKNPNKSLAIVTTQNAGNVLTQSKSPLLICDVWEHAYYIDYRNNRVKYLENYWKLIDWTFVDKNFSLK